MNVVKPFLRLVRLPNLLFIVLTQLLFQYCVYYPIYKNNIAADDHFRFFMLVLASVFIAAAGYIINDYFDIDIDRINKPEKMVVGKIITRRSAVAWHLILSIAGIGLTVLGVKIHENWYLIIANVITVIVLWLYSAKFKKDLLVGNIIISVLAAWTILIIFLSKYSFFDAFGNSNDQQLKLFRFAILYAGFAFIVTLIREAIKDIEDMHGDIKYGCKTMPVLWGITATKVYIAVWLSILILMISIVQFYLLKLGWWIPVLYAVAFMLWPLANLFTKLNKAETTQDYHRLSTATKWIMLYGILSMIFFYFYL